MLPIVSPFDTFRVGLWVARQNFGIILAYLALMTVLNALSVLSGSDALMELIGIGGSLLVSLASLVAMFLVSALLIFPLHATFLSDGRVAGRAAIGGFSGLRRVALRSALIFFAAVIPTIIVFFVAASAFAGGGRGFSDAVVAAQAGDSAAGDRVMKVMIAMMAAGALNAGASIILLGLRIPQIVGEGTIKAASGSIQRGARQFWPMAAKLVAGPGVVLFVQYVIWWGVLSSPAEHIARGPAHPVTIATNLIVLVIYAFCVAMTAGVLSDAYRRALAQEEQSTQA